MEDPSIFTLGEAARATGKSKSTISKALKSGKLSYRDKTKSGYVIDAVELFRAFPKNTIRNVEIERLETLEEPLSELARLRAENNLLREQRDDLSRRLDAESEERRRLTERLLPAPSEGIFKKLGQFFSGN